MRCPSYILPGTFLVVMSSITPCATVGACNIVCLKCDNHDITEKTAVWCSMCKNCSNDRSKDMGKEKGKNGGKKRSRRIRRQIWYDVEPKPNAKSPQTPPQPQYEPPPLYDGPPQLQHKPPPLYDGPPQPQHEPPPLYDGPSQPQQEPLPQPLYDEPQQEQLYGIPPQPLHEPQLLDEPLPQHLRRLQPQPFHRVPREPLQGMSLHRKYNGNEWPPYLPDRPILRDNPSPDWSQLPRSHWRRLNDGGAPQHLIDGIYQHLLELVRYYY